MKENDHPIKNLAFINGQNLYMGTAKNQINPSMVGKKKGNVDSDIIFHIMKKMYKREAFSRIILVSGDGDYKLLVDFLIEEKKFEKILFPDRIKRSSLYKSLSNKFFAYLDDIDIKNKIKKRKGCLR